MLRALFIALALIAVPLAGAEWRAAGGLEPDTERDRKDGMMFPDPDANGSSSRAQVHFHGFVAAPLTSLNPNVAFVGSRILPAPALHHRAMLGVWKDCNGDGYVGHAESALVDYPGALLSDLSACPPHVRPEGVVHNADGWVRELLDIGMVDPCEYERDANERERCGVEEWARNERVFYINDTYVWADLGQPGSIPQAECLLAPLPSGTTSGSGAMIGWADCQSRRGIVSAVNDVDAFFGGIGLAFEDPSHPESSRSLLNQRFPVTPFGHAGEPGLLQDDTDRSSVQVWDCSDAPFAEVNDPNGYREIAVTDPTGKLPADDFPQVIVYTLTGVGFADEDNDPQTPGVYRRALTDEDGTYARIPAVDPEVHDVRASWWRALEDGIDGPVGDCDSGTSSALAGVYFGRSIESDASPILEARKDRPSLTFTFYDGHRGLRPDLDQHLGPMTPSDGGTLWLDHGRGGDGPMWSALAQSDQDPQIVDREDLEPTGPVYFTYYAALGEDAFSFTLPSYDSRRYGVENCGSFDSGLHNGWLCDAKLWWRDASGDDNTPRYARGERIGRLPGDPYQLRDVDCYDGELVRGTGLYASLVYAVAEGACL